MSTLREANAARLAKNIRARRHRSGISQEELAFRAGLHRTEVGLLERGRRDAKLSTILKLAGALSISPTALLEGMEPEAPAFRLVRERR